MNFLNLFDEYNWFSGTWVIHTASECWVILSVDSSGNTIPETRHYVRKAESSNLAVRFQSPEQAKKWQKLNGGFYACLMKRAENYKRTFSTENLDLLRQHLTELPAYDVLVRDSKIPQGTFVSTLQKPYESEQRLGLLLADYMLHLDQADALSFIGDLAVHWAASLPLVPGSDPLLEKGRYLHLLAEQME
jgi:hypothetical protein